MTLAGDQWSALCCGWFIPGKGALGRHAIGDGIGSRIGLVVYNITTLPGMFVSENI
jgi:hypothetical protein